MHSGHWTKILALHIIIILHTTILLPRHLAKILAWHLILIQLNRISIHLRHLLLWKILHRLHWNLSRRRHKLVCSETSLHTHWVIISRHLRHAHLIYSLLRHAYLLHAHLGHTHLRHTHLRHAHLLHTHLWVREIIHAHLRNHRRHLRKIRWHLLIHSW